MKERPILFSAPMVRAILDGRKTQTRRVVKPQPPSIACIVDPYNHDFNAFTAWTDDYKMILSDGGAVVGNQGPSRAHWSCPYGVPGDRLWVRETWSLACDLDGEPFEPERVYYRADPDSGHIEGVGERKDGSTRSPWRPSIHMRRSWSRITLEVTDVRVERLQDISDDDAQAEGARRFDDIPTSHPYPGHEPRWSCGDPLSTDDCMHSPKYAFANLWDRINGLGAWDANPWVWAIAFKRVRP